MISNKLGGQIVLSTFVLLVVAAAATALDYREYVRGAVPGAGRPTPPGQPTGGPGGSDYKFGAVTSNSFGADEGQCTIFEPAKPTPHSAPVIVFLHGWQALSPAAYGRWINHIVRKGNIVIHPAYQRPITPGEQFTPNAIKATKDALAVLETPGHVKPDLTRFAIVGHSAGGTIAMNIAALAAAEDLPKPRVVMAVEPGRWLTEKAPGPKLGIPLADLSLIPADTFVMVLVGDADKRVGDGTAKEIFGQLEQIPAANKCLVTVQSDDYGAPPLVADHLFPATRTDGSVNPLAFYSCWRLFDTLTDLAFGQRRVVVLAKIPRLTFMGAWSDGRPMREMVVVDHLAE